MKKLVKQNDYIQAMAIINPQFCNTHTIQVEIEQRNEGQIPHIHVYHDHTRNPKKCSFIRLDIPKYSEHHKKGKNKPLDSKLKKEFIELMESTWGKYIIQESGGIYRPATGYEAAVMIWVDTYEEGDLSKFNTDENGDLIPLDYSNL